MTISNTDVFMTGHQSDIGQLLLRQPHSPGRHCNASIDVIGMSWICWWRENCTVTQPVA